MFTKLVTKERGGYCFEQNTLFAAVLESLGYEVRRLGARVGNGDPSKLMRTHLVLGVRVNGHELVADVGFGAGALLYPVPLHARDPVVQHGREFRLQESNGIFTLQQRGVEQWHDQYHFTLESFYETDVVVANHYTSTHPDSGFVRVATVQRNGMEEQRIVRGRTLTLIQDRTETKTIIESESEYAALLGTHFNVRLPDDFPTVRWLEVSPPLPA
ncbi:MAG: hypothetical protein NVSMB57_03500 [Actinomycetota bacterium]